MKKIRMTISLVLFREQKSLKLTFVRESKAANIPCLSFFQVFFSPSTFFEFEQSICRKTTKDNFKIGLTRTKQKHPKLFLVISKVFSIF